MAKKKRKIFESVIWLSQKMQKSARHKYVDSSGIGILERETACDSAYFVSIRIIYNV